MKQVQQDFPHVKQSKLDATATIQREDRHRRLINEDNEYSDPEVSDFLENEQMDTVGEQRLPPMTDRILQQAIDEEQNSGVSCNRFQQIQREFRPKHRETAVKWLLQLNFRFGFSRDAVYSAIAYFDLVAARIPIPRAEIQGYAIACYCLSVKIDMRMTPTVEQLHELTGQQFTAEELFQTELHVLQALSFRLSYGTIVLHMRIYTQFIEPTPTFTSWTNFLAELALLKFEFLDYVPSIVARAVVVFSAATLGMMVEAREMLINSYCHDATAVEKCTEILRVNAKATIHTWQRPSSDEFQELLRMVDLDVDLKPVLFIAD
jgi:hypothetical protein